MERARYPMENMSGSWSGRLIDVGGYEGEVNLSLQDRRGSLEGIFAALIESQHRPVRVTGKVGGRVKNAELSLMVDLGQQDATVSVSFEGSVFNTRSGEDSLCGRYAVSARRPSPL